MKIVKLKKKQKHSKTTVHCRETFLVTWHHMDVPSLCRHEWWPSCSPNVFHWENRFLLLWNWKWLLRHSEWLLLHGSCQCSKRGLGDFEANTYRWKLLWLGCQTRPLPQLAVGHTRVCKINQILCCQKCSELLSIHLQVWQEAQVCLVHSLNKSLPLSISFLERVLWSHQLQGFSFKVVKWSSISWNRSWLKDPICPAVS